MRGGPFLWHDRHMEQPTPLLYCAEMVQRLDKDRFLTALFAPEPARSHLFALYAFNLEVARTREQVSEPMIGEIRLQWWRDAVEAIYQGTPPEHEVVQALALAVRETGLERSLLDRLINARGFDLYDDPMTSMDALMTYVEESSSCLMLAALSVLGMDASDASSDAAKKSGQAWGLVGLLRALPLHLQRQQKFLPEDILTTHGITWDQLSSDSDLDTVHATVGDVADVARIAAKEGRLAARSLPSNALPALLPASLVPLYLKRYARQDFDPRTESPEVPVFRKQLTLVKHALLRRL